MPISPYNILRHELIGLYVKVKKSRNASQEGLKGKVVDETYNMLVVEGKDGKERRVAKKDCVFVFTLPDGRKVEVDGKLLVGRPEDRIKKKLPRW